MTRDRVADVVIERFRDEDARRAAELEQVLFPRQEPWSEAQFLATLREPHVELFAARMPAAGAGTEITDAPSEAVDSPSTLAGYAVLAAVGPSDDPEFEVYDIAVDPDLQGRGIGRALLRAMLARADERGAPVFLEVATGNIPARTLYEAHDFAVIGMRRNYYRPSGENAYTMARPRQLAAETTATEGGRR